jgi:hypothetical protein
MDSNTILENLSAYKNTLNKKINSDNSIIKNELNEGQMIEVDIIIDMIKFIQLGESADWKKIHELTNLSIEKIKKSNNLEELIFGLYDTSTIIFRGSSLTKDFDMYDLIGESSFWQSSQQNRTKAFGESSFGDPEYLESSGDCCERCKSKMNLVESEDELFFRCSKSTCNIKSRLNKADLINIINFRKRQRKPIEDDDWMGGLMDCYPDWDPDDMDIDDYREANGLD